MDKKNDIINKTYSDLHFSNEVICNKIYRKTKFDCNEFDKITFENCELYEVEFFGDIFSDCVFLKTNFEDVQIYGIFSDDLIFGKCNFKNVKFLGCFLKESVFRKCHFENCIFDKDNMNHQTDLSDSDFENCVFSNTIFSDVVTNSNSIMPRFDGFDVIKR